MAIRKKLITFKNFPTVLTTYTKRHRKFIKTVLTHQRTQNGLFNVFQRRFAAEFAVFSVTPGELTPMQLDAVQKVLVRKFARLFRMWTLIRFTGMVTAKPREIRMGKGKGAFSFWSRCVRIGMPLFELGFIKWYPVEYLYHIVRRLKAKLPFHIFFSLRLGTNIRLFH